MINAETVAQAQEASCRAVFDALGDAVLVHDAATGEIWEVNRQMCDLFGYSPEEARRLNIRDLVRDGHLPSETNPPPGLQEWQVKDRSGRQFWVEARLNRTYLQGREQVCAVLREITGRKQMEADRRERESIYRLMMEGSLAGVYIIQEGKFSYVNALLAQIFGCSAEEMMSGRVMPEDLVHPDDLALVRENVSRRRTGEVDDQHYTFRGRRRDGAEIYCEVLGGRMEYRGKPALMGILVDRTAKESAEKALKESETRYRIVTEGSLAGVYMIQDGKFLYVNPILAQTFGYRPEDIIERLSPLELVHPEDRDLITANLRRRLSREEDAVQYCFRGLRQDGSPIHCEILSRYTEYQGRPAFLGTLLDISERVQAERALQDSEERYRAIVEDQTEMVCRHLPDTTVTFVNEALCRYFGRSREELLGQSFLSSIPEVDRDRLMEVLAGLSRDNPILILEQRVLNSQGEIRWQQWTNRGIFDARGRLLEHQAVGRDITERKRAEEELKASEAKYRNLVEQIPAITYMAALDDVSTQVYISPQIEAILGFTPEEWLADREMFKKQLHPEDRDRVLTDLLLSYATGGPFAAEYRFLSKTGRIVWVRDESRAVYDSEGRPLFMQGVVLDITNRKKAEEALREANNKLRALVQASPLAIVGLDLHGKVVSWNPAAEQIFGWRANEVMGRPHPIIPEEQKEEFKRLWQQLLQGEPFTGLELRRRKKDGSLIDVSLSTAPLYDAAGKLAGAMGVIEDITARKCAAEALRESEARFRAMFEGAPIGMALVDLQRTVQEANPALREMGGYSEAEMRRLRPMDLTHPEDREADHALFTELVAGKRNRYQIEKRYRHKQDHWVWARLSVSLVRDAAGQPQFAISMVEDITERKWAQETTEEVRRQQEAILSNIPDIVWLKDQESRFIVVNESFGRACGVSPPQLVGKTDLDIWPRDLALRYRADDREVMRTGKRKQVEEPMAGRKGNTVWIETIKTPIFNERREVIGTAGIARDITERRRMEEALRKVSRALKAVTECDQALLRATNEAELLSEVCRIIVEVGGYRMAWVGFAHQDEERTVRPMAQEGFDEGYVQTLGIVWADKGRGRGPVGTAIRTGKPAIVRDTQNDPRFAPWREEAIKRGYASVLALPLGDPQTFGALAIYAAEVNAFDDEEINLLLRLTNDLAYGIKALRLSAERQRAEEALQDSEQKLRLLASQLLTVQEKERRRVSRELHDELGQALTVLKIHLVAIENKLRRDQQELKVNCEYLFGYIDAVIENVRRLSWDLSPSILEDLGLSSSLKYLVQETCRNNRMLHTLAMDEIDSLFSPEVRINIYRIFQESLTNIVRHADANRIDVEIKKQEDWVSFLIKDDGKGFDLKKARSRPLGKRGLGLTTMNERALMTGGTLSIWSRKGKGTGVTLTIPIQTQG